MRTKHILLLLVCLISIGQPLAAQSSVTGSGTSSASSTRSTRNQNTDVPITRSNESQNPEISAGNIGNHLNLLIPNVQLALSTPDYRVTAGDVYILAYSIGTNAVEYPITVDSTYRIRVSNLGVIDIAGKTYNQVKTQIENIVSNNYPLGGVQFVLKQPATFKVQIKGEVTVAREVTAWALTRLSTLLDEYLTPYSSTRNISIKSSNGQVKSYDLYKARRMGDLSQNPYVRPDDAITINRIERQVTIAGEVERPETYQLLKGENLKQLIEIYGNGFTPIADTSRIQLVRLVGSASTSGETISLTAQEVAQNYELYHYDTITVPTITDLKPVLFVEGAVSNAISETGQQQVDPDASTRLTVPFTRGEYYGTLIRKNRNWFSAVSDTKNAYIIRGDDIIPINLNPILYDENFRGNDIIIENDTLIIPFRQYFVTVAGAVAVPGRYPYIPDRAWDYYVALAGGFVAGRNAFAAIDIVDISGKKLTKNDFITPETIITAKSNNPLFTITQLSPVLTVVVSVLSVVTTILTLQNLTK